MVENMSWFTGDDGTRYQIFGEGGGAALAGELGVPLLGRIPLLPAMGRGADDGVRSNWRLPAPRRRRRSRISPLRSSVASRGCGPAPNW